MAKLAAETIRPPRGAVTTARPSPITVAEMVESIVGCKWSLQVLALVRQGTTRPGAMTRTTRGLTTKVLNERLAKMIRFGILSRTSFPEVPPRVEYAFTPFGRRFLKIIDAVEELQESLPQRRGTGDAAPRGRATASLKRSS